MTTGCAACDEEQKRTGEKSAMCIDCECEWWEHEIAVAERGLVSCLLRRTKLKEKGKTDELPSS